MAKQLFVFDLDFTLWDCGGTWIDHSDYPFTRRNNKVYDSSGAEMRLYPDVREILEQLTNAGITMALASRTGAPSWAHEMLELQGIRSYFDYEEIYPGSKTKHFSSLQGRTGISYADMVFFDDESRNIQEVGELGVDSIMVRNGITLKQVEPYL